MPKGKGKGKQKNPKVAGDGQETKETGEDEFMTEIKQEQYSKQLALEIELKEVNDDIKQLKDHVAHLQKEQELLLEETDKTKQESEEYISYMNKKTMKRQSLIISLGDKNKHELYAIENQKKELEIKFQKKIDEVNAVLHEKEKDLFKVESELNDLQQFKQLQQEQEKKISELEAKLDNMKFTHAERTRNMKSNFLREKEKLSIESELKIAEMSKDAKKQAWECLEKYVIDIRNENHFLRHELTALAEQSSSLQKHKQRLEKQYKDLLRKEQIQKELMQQASNTNLMGGYTLLSPTGRYSTMQSNEYDYSSNNNNNDNSDYLVLPKL